MRPSAVYRVLLQLQRVISLRRTTQVPRRVEVWKFDIQLRCVLAHRAPAYGAQHGCEGRMCRHRSLYYQFQNALASELAFFFYSGLSDGHTIRVSVEREGDCSSGGQKKTFIFINISGRKPSHLGQRQQEDPEDRRASSVERDRREDLTRNRQSPAQFRLGIT